MGPRGRALSADFSAVYREHADFIWRVLARRGVHDSLLEDATQEVFIVAHRRWGSWEPGPVRPWLYGVARRVASTHHRSQGRERRKREALPSPPPSPAIDEHFEARARLDLLAAAIEELEPDQREVFTLAEIEELTAPEIARALGCKLNTVYSRLRRARAKVALTLVEDDTRSPSPAHRLPSNTSGVA